MSDVFEYLDELKEKDYGFAMKCEVTNEIFEMGRMLRKIRKSKGLTQDDVAERSGITRQMVSRIERWATEPKLSTFMAYLKVLEIDIYELISEHEKDI